ncbi:hypothetical protein SeMB42_g00545 [Synchytrium endobioticum]|uniref:Thioredoxin domain-containing protein n=1 Tax=Synchytrium endobioticum TaxID=286115 RepID=A0A507DR30_9FUNG|nr:hypothetical protein SeLEV6574_g01173 [Synchytrium endobioticum]TPX53901.1 hypothetical protein SeMB42_g00545 [Synchytrium endobioticum]
MMLSRLSLSRSLLARRKISTTLIREPANQAIANFHSSAARFQIPQLGCVYQRDDRDFPMTLDDAGDTPVIVEFYADWCAPCRVLYPILKNVVEKNGKTFLVKVNIENADDTAEKYSISSVPTVAAFKRGEMIDRFVGSRSEADVTKFVEKAVSS